MTDEETDKLVRGAILRANRVWSWASIAEYRAAFRAGMEAAAKICDERGEIAHPLIGDDEADQCAAAIRESATARVASPTSGAEGV